MLRLVPWLLGAMTPWGAAWRSTPLSLFTLREIIHNEPREWCFYPVKDSQQGVLMCFHVTASPQSSHFNQTATCSSQLLSFKIVQDELSDWRDQSLLRCPLREVVLNSNRTVTREEAFVRKLSQPAIYKMGKKTAGVLQGNVTVYFLCVHGHVKGARRRWRRHGLHSTRQGSWEVRWKTAGRGGWFELRSPPGQVCEPKARLPTERGGLNPEAALGFHSVTLKTSRGRRGGNCLRSSLGDNWYQVWDEFAIFWKNNKVHPVLWVNGILQQVRGFYSLCWSNRETSGMADFYLSCLRTLTTIDK